jgi:PAS domain S-box-containing protein
MRNKQAADIVFEMNMKKQGSQFADEEAWNKMLDAVFHQSNEAVVLMDYHGNVVISNFTASEMFGYTMAEFEQLRLSTLLKANDEPDLIVTIPDLLRLKEKNIRGVNKENYTFSVNIRMSSISSSKSVYALLFIATAESPLITAKTLQRRNAEIIKLKETNSQLKNQAERALRERTQILQETIDTLSDIQAQLKESLRKEIEANEKCSKFAYLISHEYRTPLTSILSSLHLIEKYSTHENALTELQVKHLNKARENVKQLVSVSEELLHLNTTLNNHHRPAIKQVELSAFLSEIGKSWQFAKYGDHEVPIRIFVPEKVCIETNIELLKQIINNLIGNAVKYSDGNGEVVIECIDEKSSCAISIKDNGRGIPKEELHKLSQGFYRATNAAGVDGNGLGLFIVRQFLEHLNGQLELESEINFGTCATIRLPKKYEEKSIVN